MASRSTTPHLEASMFSFQSSQLSEDWKTFYTRALDYLEALNIDTDEPDDNKTSWKQLKMMLDGKDWQTLQTLLNNETMAPEHQKTPRQVPDASATTFKSEDHFWHFQDELLSDMCQRPNGASTP